MHQFPTEYEIYRAQARLGLWIFGVMAIGTVWFAVVVGAHCLLGWW
jgi:hypothetical protein